MTKDISMNRYQSEARRTEKDNYNIPSIVYHSLALAGEAGEVANKIKKIFRDDDGSLTRERQAEICDELGDVLWYVAMLADWSGWDLNEVARRNLLKVAERNGIEPADVVRDDAPSVDVDPPMPTLLQERAE